MKKKERLKEVKRGCKMLEDNRQTLNQQHINPEPLIEELHREGNVLSHDIENLENNKQ